MAKNSNIEWCDHTFNIVWGCVKVSPGCENCYAETLSRRWGNDVWGPAKTTRRRIFGDKHWGDLEKWNEMKDIPGVRGPGFNHLVFCGSMCDVFEDHPDTNEQRQYLFKMIEVLKNLDFQLLTKRPENIMKMVPDYWQDKFPENVWIGTSVEDQQRADERIPALIRVPCRVKFLSCEPLLEAINITGSPDTSEVWPWTEAIAEGHGINWVIVGGESGPKKRPFNPDWARSIRDQCKAAGVPFFFKQMDKVQPIPDDLMIRNFPR